jgi:tetratricopeptide (TPR) repeat protein
LYAQDKPTAALEHFNRALLYGATYAQMYMDIAQVYDELGYTSAALDSYERYIKLAGEDANPMAQSRVIMLRGE